MSANEGDAYLFLDKVLCHNSQSYQIAKASVIPRSAVCLLSPRWFRSQRRNMLGQGILSMSLLRSGSRSMMRRLLALDTCLMSFKALELSAGI